MLKKSAGTESFTYMLLRLLPALFIVFNVVSSACITTVGWHSQWCSLTYTAYNCLSSTVHEIHQANVGTEDYSNSPQITTCVILICFNVVSDTYVTTTVSPRFYVAVADLLPVRSPEYRILYTQYCFVEQKKKQQH